jgi:cell division protein FtsN
MPRGAARILVAQWSMEKSAMNLRRTGVILMGLVLLAGLSGCSHEQRDWRSAQTANTVEAYEEFVTTHPKSARAADAQARIAELTEERDWRRASTTDTADAYRQFLAQHPQAKMAQEARTRIENFGLNATAATPAPGTAAAPGSTQAPATPASKPPSAPTTAVAAAEPENTGGYSVQLGAFTTHAKALGQWRRLSARFGPELQGAVSDVERAKSGSGRKVYRLKVKGLTEARARSICTALKKRAEPCVVRKG